ncbi:VWA domain-containing protein [Alphaproteobacteria bacterium]|jgi:Ca-activated chloride channel family protein|nr:VWA domain-containing protein [Alphaproteobacteria bacterium]
MTLQLKLTPQRNALLKGFDNEFYALLQITDENINQENGTKKNLNLSIVLDKSGSMSGQPFEEAKKAAVMIIQKLRPTDSISVVAYDEEVDLVVPSIECVDKTNIIRAVNNIQVGGATNLHGGWLMGAEQVALKKSNKNINRVLLLSDGNANSGLITPTEIGLQCSKLSEKGVTTSTYGLGYHFNEELMVKMANSGLGQSYYGQTSEDLMDPFNEEFQTLINTIATEIKVKEEHPSFINVELMNNYQRSDDIYKLPDLAEGGEGWALFKININQNNISEQKIEVLRCNVSYRDTDGNIQNQGPVKIVLDPVNANAFEMVAEDEKVRLRISEILVAKIQERAREAAQLGDWNTVTYLLDEARKEAKDNQWLNSVIDSIEVYAKNKQQQQFSKEAMYSSEKMQKRMVSDDELNMSYDYNVENEKQAYLRRKTERGKRF